MENKFSVQFWDNEKSKYFEFSDDENGRSYTGRIHLTNGGDWIEWDTAPDEWEDAEKLVLKQHQDRTPVKAPNGLNSYLETFYEIVAHLTREDAPGTMAHDTHEAQGIGGLYLLAEKLADKFEAQNIGNEWENGYFEEIEKFLDQAEKEHTNQQTQ